MRVFPILPEAYFPDMRLFDRQVMRVVNGLMQGKTNNTGQVTLQTHTSTTQVTVTAGSLGVDTVVVLVPITPEAAEAQAQGPVFVSNRWVDQQVFEITHTVQSDSQCTFQFVLIG